METTAVTAGAVRREPPANLRPTLVIGLGGTGHRILVQLKAQLYRAYGAVPEARIRLLAFDTADEALTLTVAGQPVALEPDRELFHIGNTPVPNILRNLERQPAIAARLPTIQTLPPVVLRGGARQIRSLGLLALLWRFDEVEQRLSDAIWALAGKEMQGQRSGNSEGINVFICNSLVGGTGAGMFLDVAYLVRALFAELGSMGEFCYITGVGVLPQAFRGVEGPNLLPNTVAALKELSHCMLRGGFTGQYPNGRWIQTPQPPFDLYYLIDGVDERGHTWRGLNDLCAMAAAGLFLQIGSQVGRKGENDFDNLTVALAGQTADGEGTFCGSFGMATLTFPAADVAAWCAARLAGQLVERVLLRPHEPQTASAAAFLAAQFPEPETLLTTLSQDENGAPLSVDLASAPALGSGVTPAEIIRYVHDYRQVRVQGDGRLWVHAHGETLTHRLTAALHEQVQAFLSDPAVEVVGTAIWLQALQAQLAALVARWEKERAAAEADLQHWEGEWPLREEALRQAGEAFFLLRGRALAEARARYLEVATAALTETLRLLAAEAALAALAELQRTGGRWQQRLGRLQAGLTAAREQLAAAEATAQAAQNGRSAAVATINLAEPEYCATLYQRHAPSPAQTAALLRHTALNEWCDLPPAEIATQLRTAAAQPFQAVADLTVEAVLQERGAEVSPQAHKERLFRLAAPSWNLDLTRLEDGGAQLRTVQVLGVPDESRSLFQTELRMLVSTFDPTSVVAFLATIGAPYSALLQYPEYERIYQSARRIKPLHVLPQFQTEGEQARLAFALGLLFEMIFSRGFYFYYRPADPLDPALKLDNGLANALRRFAQNDPLVQEVMERVEQRIAEMGTTAALTLLASYYNADGDGSKEPAGAPDGLVLELRKLVRTYAGELRRMQQAAAPLKG